MTDLVPGGPAPYGGLVPEIRACISVTSTTFSPDEITARLGVKPRSSHRMGELRRPGTSEAVFKLHSWFSPRATGGLWDLESHIADLLDAWEPRASALHELQREPDTTVRILVGVALNQKDEVTNTPAFSLSRELLQRLARLDVELDCDVNVYGYDEEQRGGGPGPGGYARWR